MTSDPFAQLRNQAEFSEDEANRLLVAFSCAADLPAASSQRNGQPVWSRDALKQVLKSGLRTRVMGSLGTR